MDRVRIAKELVRIATVLLGAEDFKPNHAVKSVLDKFGLKFVKTKMGDYSSMSAASTKYIFTSDREFSKDELWQIKKELENAWRNWVKDEAKRLNSRNRHSVYVSWRGWDTSDTIEVQKTTEYEIQFH